MPGALAVGRFAPEVLDVAPWPYVLLGCAYAGLSIGLLVVGAAASARSERSHSPLGFRTVATFTGGGILLALATVLLVVAQI